MFFRTSSKFGSNGEGQGHGKGDASVVRMAYIIVVSLQGASEKTPHCEGQRTSAVCGVQQQCKDEFLWYVECLANVLCFVAPWRLQSHLGRNLGLFEQHLLKKLVQMIGNCTLRLCNVAYSLPCHQAKHQIVQCCEYVWSLPCSCPHRVFLEASIAAAMQSRFYRPMTACCRQQSRCIHHLTWRTCYSIAHCCDHFTRRCVLNCVVELE